VGSSSVKKHDLYTGHTGGTLGKKVRGATPAAQGPNRLTTSQHSEYVSVQPKAGSQMQRSKSNAVLKQRKESLPRFGSQNKLK